MMIESRPNHFWMSFVWLGLLIIGVPLFILLLELVIGWPEINFIAMYFLAIWIIFASFMFIVGMLPEVQALTIDDEKIVVTNVLTRRTKETSLENLVGFKVLIRFSGYGGLFDLMLVKQAGAYELIPLLYIDNIDEIVTALEKRLSNLTQDEYGILQRRREQERG